MFGFRYDEIVENDLQKEDGAVVTSFTFHDKTSGIRRTVEVPEDQAYAYRSQLLGRKADEAD